MKLLVTGASGLIGSALTADLEARGHSVVRLVRRAPRGAGEAAWDPDRGTLDRAALAGVEGAVHLAGERLDAGRWTPERKRRIRASRVRGGGRRLPSDAARSRPRLSRGRSRRRWCPHR